MDADAELVISMNPILTPPHQIYLNSMPSFLLLFNQSLSPAWLFVTPWTAALQASLSFTISQNLLKFTSIESVMLSNRLILCCPFLVLPSAFPSVRVSQLFASGGQSIGASALTSVLPMSIQSWFPLGLIGLISLLESLLQHHSSKALILQHCCLDDPTHTSIHAIFLMFHKNTGHISFCLDVGQEFAWTNWNG